MTNPNVESGPKRESQVTSQVEQEIPSFVTNKPTKSKLVLIGFVGVLGVLAYFVLAGKEEPADKKAAKFESGAGVGGIPSDLQEKMDALAKGLPGSAPARPGRPGRSECRRRVGRRAPACTGRCL